MTRRMLINAQTSEEVRIAIVSDSQLDDFQVEFEDRNLSRGNVYRGIVTNIQPSLNAAFIDYGAEKHGFLSVQEIVPEAYHRPAKGRPRIQDVVERGKPILVQVSKDAEGQKGAALTTSVSLAGRYLVLTPFDTTRGVSRKVEDDEVRAKLRQQVEKLNVPEGAGFIVRTNALEQTKTTLSRDFGSLLRLWKQIETDFREGSGPRLLYSDQDVITQTLRDYLDASIAEVLVDNDAAYNKAREYLRAFMPRGKVKVTRYTDRMPLFARHGVEAQIERIYDRTVKLRSGGSIVIDRTEALVAIDVNSGKSTRAGSQEETAQHTNLEAASEVARQLRLRDIGGLIVVDFIDMRSGKGRAAVERALRDAMKNDKARSTVGRISPNGLLEINRQRIHQALHLRTQRPCPTCNGTGRIASPELVGLTLLRRIQERASTRPVSRVRIALHPELADAFQNTRRQQIAELEREFEMRVEVIASPKLHRPEQEIEWFEREHAAPAPHAPAQQKPAEPKAAAPTAAAAPEPRPSDAQGEGKKRRRRGKRRRKNGEPADAAETQLPLEQEHEEPELEDFGEEPFEDENGAAEDEPEAGAPATAVAGEQENGRPKRRRRSRRRRRGGADRPDAATTPAAPAGEVLHAAPPVESDDDFDEDEPEAGGEEAGTSPHDSSTGTADASAEPRRGRKRRRRRRRGAVAGDAPAPLADDLEIEHVRDHAEGSERRIEPSIAPPARRAEPIIWNFTPEEKAVLTPEGVDAGDSGDETGSASYLDAATLDEAATAALETEAAAADWLPEDSPAIEPPGDEATEAPAVTTEPEPQEAPAKPARKPRKPRAPRAPRAPRKKKVTAESEAPAEPEE